MEFSWLPPKFTGTRVIRYRLTTRNSRGHRCWQLDPTTRTFRFNDTSGFQAGENFKFVITAEPIKRDESRSINMKLEDALACPSEPILRPLKNNVVPLGTNTSFHCKFQVEPNPSAKIKWFFGENRLKCAEWWEIRISDNFPGIQFSEDRRTPHIIAATKENEGCYVLLASNEFGESIEKGYLKVSTPNVIDQKRKTFWEALSPFTGFLISMVLVVAAFVILLYNCLNTPTPPDVVMPLTANSSSN